MKMYYQMLKISNIRSKIISRNKYLSGWHVISEWFTLPKWHFRNIDLKLNNLLDLVTWIKGMSEHNISLLKIVGILQLMLLLVILRLDVFLYRNIQNSLIKDFTLQQLYETIVLLFVKHFGTSLETINGNHLGKIIWPKGQKVEEWQAGLQSVLKLSSHDYWPNHTTVFIIPKRHILIYHSYYSHHKTLKFLCSPN